jgi:hypothetical protein
MGLFTVDYDPGFPNIPGFGQSVTNPLAPVYYEALGIVKDLSVYDSIYATRSINAGISFNIGDTSIDLDRAIISVPTTFLRDVEIKSDLTISGITITNRLIVDGIEYKERRIVGRNGTFTVLAAI